MSHIQRTIVLSAIALAVAGSPLRGAQAGSICGDADNDRRVTDTDAVQALRASIQLPSACVPATCDADADGAFTDGDAVRILRAAVFLPSQLSCPCRGLGTACDANNPCCRNGFCQDGFCGCRSRRSSCDGEHPCCSQPQAGSDLVCSGVCEYVFATATPPPRTKTPTPTPTETPTTTHTPAPTRTPLTTSFECYDVHHLTTGAVGSVSAMDEFGGATLDVGTSKRLCNPADVNGGDVGAPSGLTSTDHFVGYKIARIPRFQPVRRATVTDRFGTLTVEVLRPTLLLVPSMKTVAGTVSAESYVPSVDTFTCYDVGRARRRVADVAVADQLGDLLVDIKRPARICVASEIDGGSLLDPFRPRLVCYDSRLKSSSTFDPPYGFRVENQFHAARIESFRPTELCVPVQQIIATPTPTPTETPTPTRTVTPSPTPTPSQKTVRFTVTSDSTIESFRFQARYPIARGSFTGHDDSVSCTSAAPGFIANDRDAFSFEGLLYLASVSVTSLPLPAEISCTFELNPDETLSIADFSILRFSVTENGAIVDDPSPTELAIVVDLP